MLRIFGTSHRGHVRPTNQDRFGIDERLGLCVVADGMGGHNAGEIAAQLAVDAVTDHVRGLTAHEADGLSEANWRSWPSAYDRSLSLTGNCLRAAVELANLRVLESARAAVDRSGMGTTLVAALVQNGHLSVAHAGDSRLYLYNSRGLKQITRDDSWLATVLAHQPTANPDALREHPMRHVLTNVVGVRPCTDVHVSEESLDDGTVLVLTTDGVHGVLVEDSIERLLAGGHEIGQLPEKLVNAALRMGSRDNCTAVVGEYVSDGSSQG